MFALNPYPSAGYTHLYHKVADFGEARRMDVSLDEAEEMTMVGTSAYAAPEVLRCEPCESFSSCCCLVFVKAMC